MMGKTFIMNNEPPARNTRQIKLVNNIANYCKKYVLYDINIDVTTTIYITKIINEPQELII